MKLSCRCRACNSEDIKKKENYIDDYFECETCGNELHITDLNYEIITEYAHIVNKDWRN